MGDFNLPDNCTGEMVDAAHSVPDCDHVCWDCIHCIEECCDYGACELKIGDREPRDFKDWAEVLSYLDRCRVGMQEDTCAHWRGW